MKKQAMKNVQYGLHCVSLGSNLRKYNEKEEEEDEDDDDDDDIYIMMVVLTGQ